MAKIQLRRTISISGELYKNFRKFCEKRVYAMSAFTEKAIRKQMLAEQTNQPVSTTVQHLTYGVEEGQVWQSSRGRRYNILAVTHEEEAAICDLRLVDGATARYRRLTCFYLAKNSDYRLVGSDGQVISKTRTVQKAPEKIQRVKPELTKPRREDLIRERAERLKAKPIKMENFPLPPPMISSSKDFTVEKSADAFSPSRSSEKRAPIWQVIPPTPAAAVLKSRTIPDPWSVS